MRVPAEVIQVAIDDALKAVNPFYENMAKPHIPALDQKIEEALVMEGYSIVVTKELERLLWVDRQYQQIKQAGDNKPAVDNSGANKPAVNIKVGG